MQWFKNSYPIVIALLFSLMGIFVLQHLHAPMPWLLGSLLGTIVAGRFSAWLPLASPKLFSAPSRAILGITIGSAFQSDMLHYFVDFLSSLLLIFPFVVIATLCGMWYYTKIVKFDTYTAYFSAVPGGLLEMAILAESFKLDLYKVIITQSSRLLFMVLLLPFIIERISHTSLDGRNGITQPFAHTSLWDMSFILLFALIGWRLAVRFRISGGTLIIPMILGVIVYGSGLIHSRPPTEVLNVIQLILGTTVGFAFVGVSYKEMWTVFYQTLGYFLILAFICAVFVGIVAWMTDFSLLSILLAFAPGGQSEMNLIAIVVGANLPYVALHHILRIFLVIGISPLLVRFVKRT
jgi:hypothetical protein